MTDGPCGRGARTHEERLGKGELWSAARLPLNRGSNGVIQGIKGWGGVGRLKCTGPKTSKRVSVPEE